MANALDALAKKATPKSASKSSKVPANVTPAIKGKVDLVIHHKAQIAQLEAEQADAEGAIIDHVRPQQDTMGFAGNYNKTFSVPGNTGELTMVTTDRWTVPQDDASHETLKQCLGDKYDAVFTKKRTITVNDVPDETIDKIVTALSEAGMDVGSLLTVVDKVVTTKDLDACLYSLVNPTQLATIRTVVKQYKPGLK
jgi:hypothetical protein